MLKLDRTCISIIPLSLASTCFLLPHFVGKKYSLIVAWFNFRTKNQILLMNYKDSILRLFLKDEYVSGIIYQLKSILVSNTFFADSMVFYCSSILQNFSFLNSHINNLDERFFLMGFLYFVYPLKGSAN